jgi:hypothetical protein
VLAPVTRATSGRSKALERRQHTGEDFQAQTRSPVIAALDHPDFVVEAFDEAERDLVLRPTLGRDAVPVTVDHLGELLVRFEPLPLEAGPPVLEEAPRPNLPVHSATADQNSP